jgi:hypothetical protein
LEVFEMAALCNIAGLAFVALGLRRDDNGVRCVTALPPAATAKSPDLASTPKDLAEMTLILKRFSGFRGANAEAVQPAGECKDSVHGDRDSSACARLILETSMG